jgi:5-methylcytosine-specific restriction endonuclease McrA
MTTGVYERTIEHRKKISNCLKGRFTREQNRNWKGGVSSLRTKIYHTFEYQNWRNAVFERDNYTCVFCGEKDKTLNADHIKSWENYPELRFDVNNGRTLCESCHRLTNDYGSHNNTSGFVGISFAKREKRWRVIFREKSLGYFKNKDDAIRVLKDHIKSLGLEELQNVEQ